MSVSQNTENEQQNNLCTTLTEQWKKGELKEGVYYVRNEYDVVFAAENYINYDCFNDTKACDFYNVETNIKEVLAPVPSYEEWQELIQDCSDKHDKYLRLSQTNHQLHKFLEEFNALEVAKENQQLKELLKECEEVLLSYSNINGDYELYDKINNAIGDK